MAKARPLTATELKRLKRWVEFDRQLMAMVQVGLCGARVGEIANLTIGQVLQEELGSLPSRKDYTIREIIRLTPEQSKNGKAGDIYLTHEARKALKDLWVNGVESISRFGCWAPSENYPFFQSQKGGGFSPNSLAQKLNKLLKDCGIQTSSHSLRKTFACHALRNGANIETIRLALRQSSISTTQAYIQDMEQDTAKLIANMKVM